MSELTAEEKSSLTVVTGDEKTPARISYAKIFKPEKTISPEKKNTVVWF